MKLHRLLLPHSETHQKSPFLSWQALVVYILMFLVLKIGFGVVAIYKPGVLGVSSTLNAEKIIEYTNIERAKKGLPPVIENKQLIEAASQKAVNMFAENYWAHFSPSGKDPWGFINSAGYRFAYAGENLARNFSSEEDVVRAWMASSSHRENLLNGKYQEIGIAVEEGTLQGLQTTLVVQMFGRPVEAIAVLPEPEITPQAEVVATEQVAGSKSLPLKVSIDPFLVTKVLGIGLLGFVGGLLIVDFVVLKRRGVFRVSSNHLAHLSFLAVSGCSIFTSTGGSIL